MKQYHVSLRPPPPHPHFSYVVRICSQQATLTHFLPSCANPSMAMSKSHFIISYVIFILVI